MENQEYDKPIAGGPKRYFRADGSCVNPSVFKFEIGCDISETALEFGYSRFVETFGKPPASVLIGDGQYRQHFEKFIVEKFEGVTVFATGTISESGFMFASASSGILHNNCIPR